MAAVCGCVSLKSVSGPICRVDLKAASPRRERSTVALPIVPFFNYQIKIKNKNFNVGFLLMALEM